jgi:hypothetical protein
MRYVKVLMGAWPIRHCLNAPVLEDRRRLGSQRMLVGNAFFAAPRGTMAACRHDWPWRTCTAGVLRAEGRDETRHPYVDSQV